MSRSKSLSTSSSWAFCAPILLTAFSWVAGASGEDARTVVEEQPRRSADAAEGGGARVHQHQVEVAVVVHVAEAAAERVERDHRQAGRGLVGEDARAVVDEQRRAGSRRRSRTPRRGRRRCPCRTRRGPCSAGRSPRAGGPRSRRRRRWSRAAGDVLMSRVGARAPPGRESAAVPEEHVHLAVTVGVERLHRPPSTPPDREATPSAGTAGRGPAWRRGSTRSRPAGRGRSWVGIPSGSGGAASSRQVRNARWND